MKHLRIGTRGSLLAKWQAESVRKQLFAIAGVEAEIIIIKTAGDRMQQVAADADWREGNFHKGIGRRAAGRVHRPRGAQRQGYSYGGAPGIELSGGVPAR